MVKQCIPGLTGFPVQVTGFQTAKDAGIIPTTTSSDIRLQFAPTQSIPWKWDSTTGWFTDTLAYHTFFMGMQYRVTTILVTKPLQTGLLPTQPIAEFQLWGSPVDSSKQRTNLAVLIIPITMKPQGTSQGFAISEMMRNKAVNLNETIPTGPSVEIVRYSTCVEPTDEKADPVTIEVGYFTSQVVITQANASVFTNLKETAIPHFIHFTNSFILDDAGNKRQRRSLFNKRPYTTTVGASEDIFKKGFRLIRGFEQIAAGMSLDTKAFKCNKIDRSRDIKNGQLLVDPRTGERLDKEIEIAEAADQESLEKPTIYPGDIAKWIGIIVGTLLGLALLAVVVYFGQKAFARAKDVGDLPVAVVSGAAASSAAAALPYPLPLPPVLPPVPALSVSTASTSNPGP